VTSSIFLVQQISWLYGSNCHSTAFKLQAQLHFMLNNNDTTKHVFLSADLFYTPDFIIFLPTDFCFSSEIFQVLFVIGKLIKNTNKFSTWLSKKFSITSKDQKSRVKIIIQLKWWKQIFCHYDLDLISSGALTWKITVFLDY
jgi:hypothetical protein